MDQTDMEAMIAFIFHLPKTNASENQVTKSKTIFCDQDPAWL